MKIPSKLKDIWKQQFDYNERVKRRQQRSPAEWMEVYILGLMSECGQLLEAMRWKKHRLQSIEEFGPNVPDELADITKYVISMWQLIGYKPEEMLEQLYRKGMLLDSIFTQEFETDLNTNVVIFDIDNVLADTQTALAKFFELENFDWDRLRSSIHLDLAISQPFDSYRLLKNRFEQGGGYADLNPMYDLVELFQELHEQGFSIVCYTARPVTNFKRIREDTFNWFWQHGVKPDLIRFGREDRISWAAQLIRRGHNVILVDDDPNIAIRAGINQVPIIVPDRTYNSRSANFFGNTEELIIRIGEKIDEQRNGSDGQLESEGIYALPSKSNLL